MQAILSKTINLLESFIVDIALQNIYSTTNILRSHYELLASLNYYLKNPDKRDQIMWGERYDKKKKDVKTKAINIITMLERLDEDTPKNWKVLEDYEEMSQIVHPNRKSNLASIREGSKDSGGQWSHFSSHSEMSESEISTYINAHLNLVNSILNLSKNFDDLFCKTNGIQKVEPTLKEKDE